MAPGGARQRGFTLIEVLIAVGIFALIGLVSAVLLARTLEARAATEARADRLQAVQRAVQRLERDVLQYAQRGIRDEFGDPLPPLVLALDGSLELTVQGWRNPLQLPRSELQRVRWGLDEDGALERAYWAVLDRAQDTRIVRQRVLAEVGAFDVELLDGEGGTWTEWPRPDDELVPDPVRLPGDEAPAASGTPPPVALRIAVDAAPFGRIERLLLLGEAVDLQEDSIEAPQQNPGAGAEATGEAAADG